MQYTTLSPAIPALKWDRNNEDKARNEYTAIMKADHAHFPVKIVP